MWYLKKWNITSIFFISPLPQGTRMEGYADPSTAAQDAMVNTGRHGHLSHTKKEQMLMLKSDSELFKIFCIFFFFWYNRFYGKPVSKKQANTKTCFKWYCATGVTSSCGWVIQWFSSLTKQRKGKIWLAIKIKVYISSSADSRILTWTITLRISLMLMGFWK